MCLVVMNYIKKTLCAEDNTISSLKFVSRAVTTELRTIVLNRNWSTNTVKIKLGKNANFIIYRLLLTILPLYPLLLQSRNRLLTPINFLSQISDNQNRSVKSMFYYNVYRMIFHLILNYRSSDSLNHNFLLTLHIRFISKRTFDPIY